MRTVQLRLLPLLVIASLFAAATPAAAVTTISMDTLEDGWVYLPSRPNRPVGATFRWENIDNSDSHTATRRGIVSWDFVVAPGETSPNKTIKFAGSYTYFCVFHEAMDGRLGVRPTVARDPEREGSYLLTLGTEPPPGEFVFDVQRKVGDGTWEAYRYDVTTKRLRVRPEEPVTYSFRARLRRGEAKMTDWSPRAVVNPPA